MDISSHSEWRGNFEQHWLLANDLLSPLNNLVNSVNVQLHQSARHLVLDAHEFCDNGVDIKLFVVELFLLDSLPGDLGRAGRDDNFFLITEPFILRLFRLSLLGLPLLLLVLLPWGGGLRHVIHDLGDVCAQLLQRRAAPHGLVLFDQ
jgi:hypothetical protein